jgi:hypothetical protein
MASKIRRRQKTPLQHIVHYRNRAEELRLIAQNLQSEDSVARVLQTANTYWEMAQLVEDSIVSR